MRVRGTRKGSSRAKRLCRRSKVFMPPEQARVDLKVLLLRCRRHTTKSGWSPAKGEMSPSCAGSVLRSTTPVQRPLLLTLCLGLSILGAFAAPWQKEHRILGTTISTTPLAPPPSFDRK